MEGPRQKSSMKDEGGTEQCTFLEEIEEKNYDRSDEKWLLLTALEQTVWERIWADQEKLDEIITPRYLKLLTNSEPGAVSRNIKNKMKNFIDRTRKSTGQLREKG